MHPQILYGDFLTLLSTLRKVAAENVPETARANHTIRVLYNGTCQIKVSQKGEGFVKFIVGPGHRMEYETEWTYDILFMSSVLLYSSWETRVDSVLDL